MENLEKILESVKNTDNYEGSLNFTSKVLNSLEKENTKKLFLPDYLKIAAVAIIILSNMFIAQNFLSKLSNFNINSDIEVIADEYSYDYIYPDYFYYYSQNK